MHVVAVAWTNSPGLKARVGVSTIAPLITPKDHVIRPVCIACTAKVREVTVAELIASLYVMATEVVSGAVCELAGG